MCLAHHDEYDSKTSQSKGLTMGEVRRYRDELHERFRARPTSPAMRQRASREDKVMRVRGRTTRTLDETVEALGVHEVRRVRYAIELLDDKSEAMLRAVGGLYGYAREYGVQVRLAVLEVLYSAIAGLRRDTPVTLVKEVTTVLRSAVPLVYVRPGVEKMRLVEFASEIAYSIAYDGIRYRKNITIADEGVQTLGVLVHLARVNKATSIEKALLARMDGLERAATEDSNKDAVRLVKYVRANALSAQFHGLEPPPDLMDKIFAE